MKLSERLQQTADNAVTTAGVDTPARHGRAEARKAPTERKDPFAEIKRRAHEALFERLGAELYSSSNTEKELEKYVVQDLNRIIEAERIPLTAEERKQVVKAVTNDVLGFGPIEEFLADSSVTEIMVNGREQIFIERAGRLHETEARFLTEDHLYRVIDRIVGQVGRRVDEASPMVDARLADGSRVNAVIPPLALDGAALTIRKFSQGVLSVADLIRIGTLTPQLAEFIDGCVRGKANILVSGGTGTGKTTMLNALSSMIPDDERIITIEDAAELQLDQRHLIRLEGRPPNIEGKGEIRIRDLVRNALRMRPDRIIVGEVRGGEALDMLQAMNTGHDGSLSTLHANSPRDALMRLETMVLMAGFDLPMRAVREQAASAIDLIIHVARLRDGTRRVMRVCEVEGMEGEVVTLSDVFAFDFSVVGDGPGAANGMIRPTGIRPKLAERLSERNVTFEPQLFEPTYAGSGRH
ncbi:MAG TPA: CpaF family protein [Acidimicrobiia bacterium]|nr:CpaF family protein [Acidimicrobiia bacterium]